MTDDKFLLLKMHDASIGISEDVLHEIADATRLVKLATGEYLHRANQPLSAVYLLIHGRIRQTIVDSNGNEVLRHQQTSGGQIGALASALGEPSPIEMVAEEPSTLLHLEYQKALKFTKKCNSFRRNLLRLRRNLILE